MIDRSKRVYFAKCVGPLGPIGAYKIGCSHGWNERVKQLSANLPFTLELEASVPGGMFLEAFCHHHLKDSRIGGEYFREDERVMKVVERAAKQGCAYSYVTDSSSGRDIPEGALGAFLTYHGVTLQEVSLRLGIPFSRLERVTAKPRFQSRRLLAAAAFVAQSREQFVNWPEDALSGLLGEISPALRRRLSDKSKAA